MASAAKKTDSTVPAFLPPIKGERFGLMTHKAQNFNAVVPAGISRADLVDKRLWSHVATQIQSYAEIRVVCEDGSYMARLLVTFKNGIDLRLHELEWHDLDKIEDLEAHPDYEVRSKGAILKWCIIRKNDGSIVKEKLENQAAALHELAEYLRALGEG